MKMETGVESTGRGAVGVGPRVLCSPSSWNSGLGLCCRADSSFQIFVYTAVGLCFEFHSFIIGLALTCPLPPTLPRPQDTGRGVKDTGPGILASILVPCLLLSDCGLGHTSCFFESVSSFLT